MTLVEAESQSSENAAACPGFSGVLYKARMSPGIDKSEMNNCLVILFLLLSHHQEAFFQDRVSLCSPGCPGTHPVDQADLKLRELPASAF